MPIDLLLLLALPASGKSEVRRYLEHLPPQVAADDLHLGPTVQVDDYPYVHLMRRISQEQRRLGIPPSFFADDASPFLDARDWITLIHLIREDVAGLGRITRHESSPESLLERFAAARTAAGIPAGLPGTTADLAAALTADAARLAADLPVVAPDDLAGATVLVEFARGGPEGATPPLPPPLGYAASLTALGPDILERASILWVVTDPEESRRRNRERARPGPDGDASILHHGVPEAVIRHDYGMDDLGWLMDASPVPGTIAVADGALSCLIPIERFDNRVDRTSFLRGDPGTWPAAAVADLHRDLALALGRLAAGSTG